MRTLIVLALCSLAGGTGVTMSAQDTAPGTTTTYLVVYHPGPGWLAGKPLSEQPLKEHGRYMLSLYVKGSLKIAGPFLDDTGGAVVLEADNETEAKAAVASDPAVASGVFVPEVHPWRLVDWEQRVKK